MKALTAACLLLLSLLMPAQATEVREVTLEVRGMVCPACPPNVVNALESVEGVTHVAVKLRERLVIVRFDASRTDVEALMQATDDAGYPSSLKE
ncbi:mercuric transport protein periplasmic component [Thioalkalivibrio denitrificans]|uniref:Mercuric transport protein periplasmic component n=1 Tax=Thioalkalivibrio denitrificans TaxID=108003 RepID=A0A1V3N7N7_9GAMM|nr:cation transporter [Thioalkalivibrio denitrificans]OOG21025.1 mercuric transport protein periplasmic component [Thioalkalivibrio denitrificans]